MKIKKYSVTEISGAAIVLEDVLSNPEISSYEREQLEDVKDLLENGGEIVEEVIE